MSTGSACRPLPINAPPHLTSHCAGRGSRGSHECTVPPRLPALLQGRRGCGGRLHRLIRLTWPVDNLRWCFAVGGLDGPRSVVLVSLSNIPHDTSPCPYVKLTSYWRRIRAAYCLRDYHDGTFSNDQCSWRLPRSPRVQKCRAAVSLKTALRPSVIITSLPFSCVATIIARSLSRAEGGYVQYDVLYMEQIISSCTKAVGRGRL